MTNLTQQPVVLEQCDRDAAGDLWETLSLDEPNPNDGYAAMVLETMALSHARHRLAERQRCAKVAEAHAAPNGIPGMYYDTACHDIAEAIRSGKEPA